MSDVEFDPVPAAPSDEPDQDRADPVGTLQSELHGALEAERGGAVMARMADAAISRYDRLPMLDVVLDRVARHFTERLMQMMSTQADAALAGVEPGRFVEMTHQINLPCLIAVVTAEEWGGDCVIAMDQKLIYTIVEILLGGEAPTAAQSREMREPTSIERRLTQRIFQTLCDQLSAGFAPLAPTRFTIQRVETTPQFAMIARSAAAAVRARIRLQVERQSGEVHLIIPYTTLEPARAQLGQMFLGESLGRDAYWDKRLAARVSAAPVRLNAQIAAAPTPLAQIMAWKPGDVIPLVHPGPQAKAVISCRGVMVGEGSVGAKNGRVAVRLEQVALAEPSGTRSPETKTQTAKPIDLAGLAHEGGAPTERASGGERNAA